MTRGRGAVVDRVLAPLRLLSARRLAGVTLGEIERDLHLGRRAIYRYLDALRLAGFRIDDERPEGKTGPWRYHLRGPFLSNR